MKTWFVPSWNGDVRLEASALDAAKTVLTVVDPTPAEQEALAEIGKTLLKRKWIEKDFTAEDLTRLGGFARYKDVDGDAVGYRTLPGTNHPQAAYFTRGSGHNDKAQYTEREDDYVNNMERLARKVSSMKLLQIKK